jgi:AcrR family transcriptional regulator
MMGSSSSAPLDPRTSLKRAPASPTTPGDGKKSTADLLLVAAAALFRKKGYSQTTTRELGRSVGIRGPSVYYHYRVKEDILYGLCRESLRKLTSQVSPLTALDDSHESLRAIIQTHVANILRDRDMHSTMLTEMRSLSAKRRATVVKWRDEYERIIRGAIERAQADRVIRTDIPAHDLTLALLSMLNWTIFWYRDDGDLSVDDVGRLLATVFLEGAGHRT